MLGFPLGILSAAGAGDFLPVFPSDITGLVARYDAADLTSISLSGSDVTQWNDLSGNGRHATQGTSVNRPQSGTRTLNGLNVLNFDGTNDFLLNDAVAASFTGEDKPFTIFFVQDKDGTADTVNWSFGSSVNNFAFFLTGRDFIFVRDNAGATAFLTLAVPTGTSSLTHRSTGLNFTSFLDGTQVNAGQAYNRGSLSLQQSTIGSGRFGSGAGNNQQFFDGGIAELAYYDRELTLSEVSQVNDYLSAKWGI